MISVAIGADHAGFALKESVKDYLMGKGYHVIDKGTHSVERVDYPDFAHAVAKSIESGETLWGVLVCGSANGVSMAANKHAGIRCAIAWNVEIARLAKMHNDANIIAFPGRFVSEREAQEMVDAYATAQFEGGRHAGRVEKIACT